MTVPARPPTIAHVGLAVRALGDALPFLRDVLGMPEVPLGDSDGARIAAVGAGEALVEVLEPADPDSPIQRFLDRRGPGIHHLCLAVDDLDGMLARCQAHGVAPIDAVPRIGAEGKRIAFLHPKATGGILIELSER